MKKILILFSLIALISVKILAQNQVQLIQPEKEALDVFDAHPNSSAVHPEPRIEFKWEAIDSADSYEFYLIEAVHLEYNNPHLGDTLTTSNNSIIIGEIEGERLPKHGYPYRGHRYAWKVRAIINGEYQEWSQLWFFHTGRYTSPNDKDQELLDQVGFFKPTSFDSIKFIAPSDFIGTEAFEAQKEFYKAFGDLYANTSQRIYFFSNDALTNQPIQEDYNKYMDPNLSEPHYMAFSFHKHPVNDLGKRANKGIGYGSEWKTIKEMKDNHPFGGDVFPVIDFHEPTHLYEDGRLLSHSGMPLWFIHMLSNIHDFTFNRDYMSQIEAKYTDGEYCRDGLLTSDGISYSSCDFFDVDHVRKFYYDIKDLQDGTSGFVIDRDALVNHDDHPFQPLAGYYLSYLTSPETVFLHFWDDRAFTKNWRDAFKDAFGMTIIEFNNKFYDWMMNMENPLDWTYILPTEHSTELYYYPKRFTTTYPDSGAVLNDLKPSFEWIASTDFSDYKIQLSTSADFSDTLHTMFVQGANSVYMDEVTYALLDISLDVNTTYYWRMQSILGVKESKWTKINSFNTGTVIDSDGDGVYDDIDICPNTPEGVSVDSVGCATSQIDSDGDGVYDDIDICPNTPEGVSVDSVGCEDVIITGNEDYGKKYFELEQNYPNPFNPRTMIKFSLARNQHVTLEVFDSFGNLIVKLIDKPMQAGEHRIGFHAALLPSGVYLYKLTTPSFTETKKMRLIR